MVAPSPHNPSKEPTVCNATLQDQFMSELFAELKLKLLQSIMPQVIVPKYGFNRKTAWDILHGPSELYGAKFLPL
jgi:hypothetical protein